MVMHKKMLTLRKFLTPTSKHVSDQPVMPHLLRTATQTSAQEQGAAWAAGQHTEDMRIGKREENAALQPPLQSHLNYTLLARYNVGRSALGMLQT